MSREHLFQDKPTTPFHNRSVIRQRIWGKIVLAQMFSRIWRLRERFFGAKTAAQQRKARKRGFANGVSELLLFFRIYLSYLIHIPSLLQDYFQKGLAFSRKIIPFSEGNDSLERKEGIEPAFGNRFYAFMELMLRISVQNYSLLHDITNIDFPLAMIWKSLSLNQRSWGHTENSCTAVNSFDFVYPHFSHITAS